MDLAEWPGAIVKLYLGGATAPSVIESARSEEAEEDLERHCEAYFYLGQYALLQGNRDEAIEFFDHALETGLTGHSNYEAAEAELARLRQ